MSEPEMPNSPRFFLDVPIGAEVDESQHNISQGLTDNTATLAGSLGLSANVEAETAYGSSSESEDAGELTEVEARLRRLLNLDVGEALHAFSGTSNYRHNSDTLKRKGVATMRDVLVMGKERIGGIFLVGPVMVGYLENVINTQCPEELRAWKGYPYMANITQALPKPG